MSTTPPPPPPPDDAFPSFTSADGSNPDPFANPEEEPLDPSKPSVAASPGRVMLVLGSLLAVLVFLLFSIFGGDDTKEVVEEPKEAQVAPASPPPAPPPMLVDETPSQAQLPVFAAPPVPTGNLPELNPKDDAAEKERQQARLRSEMVISSGGSLGGALGGGAPTPTESTDPNEQFASRIASANTEADRVVATHIGNLQRTIAQGRIIQATTESAINTELPAPIRAIVSRDVFGEAGRTPLIPKGSRLIGRYNTDLLGGQTRVYVVWTRVIRPDGVDVMINSPLVDQIGQAGIGGQVDTKFQQIFSRSVLASVVTIGVALGSDEVTGGGQTSTTNSAIGGTTQAGDGATTATVNALNRLGSTTDNFLQQFINLGPTILVDQGTPVNVFVNQDLIFPSEFTGARVIQ